MNRIKNTRIVICFLVIALLCANPAFAQARRAVPKDLVEKAVIPGFEGVRTFVDAPCEVFTADFVESIKQEPEGLFPVGFLWRKDYPVLAISGGGANGAYGAGLIWGWPHRGSRPEVKVVTGISTGALIAPFAFLGEEYDEQLRELYTSVSTKDIMRKKGALSIAGSNSVASNLRLKELVAENMTEEIMRAVAKEHARGKRLYVGTCSLDAQRLVIWDMGKIASVGNLQALELFRKVLIASSAIPVVFPPEFFEVVADGQTYDEMHVDGGTVTQVFSLFGVLKGVREAAAKEKLNAARATVKLYLIRNGSVSPHWGQVGDNLSAIAEHSMDTLTKMQAIGDMYRLYVFSKIRGVDFNLAYIPVDYEPEPEEWFDPKEMGRLFKLGVDATAVNGYPWHKKPPIMEKVEGR